MKITRYSNSAFPVVSGIEENGNGISVISSEGIHERTFLASAASGRIHMLDLAQSEAIGGPRPDKGSDPMERARWRIRLEARIKVMQADALLKALDEET